MRLRELAGWAIQRCNELERRLQAVEANDIEPGSKQRVDDAVRAARRAHLRAMYKAEVLEDYTFRYNPEHYVNGKNDPVIGIQRDVDTMENRTTEAEAWAPQMDMFTPG